MKRRYVFNAGFGLGALMLVMVSGINWWVGETLKAHLALIEALLMLILVKVWVSE